MLKNYIEGRDLTNSLQAIQKVMDYILRNLIMSKDANICTLS